MTTGVNIARADSRLGRGLMCLGLLKALVLAGCSTSALPKLEDLAAPPGSAKVAAPPPSGVSGGPATVAVPPPPTPKPLAREPRDQPLASRPDVPLPPVSRAASGSDMIVGFKGATVVLFGDEVGQDGERVSTASLTVPLQMKYAPSNISRVQIDTPYGPRWVARSEITIASDVAAPIRR